MIRKSVKINLKSSNIDLYLDRKSIMIDINDDIQFVDGTVLKLSDGTFMFPGLEYESTGYIYPKTYILQDWKLKKINGSLWSTLHSEPLKYSVYPTARFTFNCFDYVVCQLEWFLDYSTDTYFNKFMDPKNPIDPIYSEIWLYKLARNSNSVLDKKLIIRHFQTAMECCGPDTRVNIDENQKQYPGGIFGEISLGMIETQDYMYFPTSRIMNTRIMLYKNLPGYLYGYPDHLCKNIQATPYMSEYYYGNMVISRISKSDMRKDFKDWKLDKYYNGSFSTDGISGVSTALLDRSESYGRIFTIDFIPNKYFYLSQKWENGFDLFSSIDAINWNYECNIPFDDAYHPNVIKYFDKYYLIYCLRTGFDRSLQYFVNEISFMKDIVYVNQTGTSGVSGVHVISH